MEVGARKLLWTVSTLVVLEFAEARIKSTSTSTSSSSSSELPADVVSSSSPSWRKSPPLIGGVKLSQGISIRPIRYLLINRSVGAV